MKTQWKISLGIMAAFLVTVVALSLINGSDDDGKGTDARAEDPPSSLVAEDSRILGEAGNGDVVFEEFLDFECEACGAAYPLVEELRKQYAGEVTFVARYFPLPGHFNAERAARAVESAARQGKFEEMYQMMYETQSSWGEQREPLDDLFREYAEEIGLDMAQYDADYVDPDVAARVQEDVDAGNELGLQGTPSFFINGELFEPQSYEDFITALDDALAE